MPRRIEMLDDAQAEVLQRKSPAERLAISHGMWRSARQLLVARVSSLYPDWTEAQVKAEVARRLLRGTG